MNFQCKMADSMTAKLLREMRVKAGYTQNQLGTKMGTVQSNISRAEKLGCSLSFLRKVADICNCKININII